MARNYVKYQVITRPAFFGENKLLWNISEKSKQEYIPLFEYGFAKGQIVTKRAFKIFDGRAYHNGAIKKKLHIPKQLPNRINH